MFHTWYCEVSEDQKDLEGQVEVQPMGLSRVAEAMERKRDLAAKLPNSAASLVALRVRELAEKGEARRSYPYVVFLVDVVELYAMQA